MLDSDVKNLDSERNHGSQGELVTAEIANPDGFQALDPRMIRAEQIVGAIFATASTIGAIIGLIALWINLGFNYIWFVALGAILIAIGTVWYFSLFWPAIAFRHAGWILDEEGLKIHRGVLWRHRISIPIGRVQHADVSQGPLQRQFEIGKLTVHTAGTQHASVDLDGLTHTIALELRDRLVGQKKGRDAV